jgi:hypothetical protein
MGFSRSGPAALAVALVYAAAAAVLAGSVWAGVWAGAIALLPVSLIWFPDFWGEAGGRVTGETPAPVVELAGWVVLMGGPLALLLLYLLGAVKFA